MAPRGEHFLAVPGKTQSLPFDEFEETLGENDLLPLYLRQTVKLHLDRAVLISSQRDDMPPVDIAPAHRGTQFCEDPFRGRGILRHGLDMDLWIAHHFVWSAQQESKALISITNEKETALDTGQNSVILQVDVHVLDRSRRGCGLSH